MSHMLSDNTACNIGIMYNGIVAQGLHKQVLVAACNMPVTCHRAEVSFVAEPK